MGDDADGGTPDGTPDGISDTDTGTGTGDSAPATPAAGYDGARDDDCAIHFHFPIDIQVIGGVDSGVVDAVVARVFDELRRELERSA